MIGAYYSSILIESVLTLCVDLQLADVNGFIKIKIWQEYRSLKKIDK